VNCPLTGWPIPKEARANCESRQWLLEATATKEEERNRVWETCSESPIFWLNYFGWTYNVKSVDETGREIPAEQQHVPFITWAVQDSALVTLMECIDDGRDSIIDKSRDMGASWLCVALATWYWIFRDDSQILLVSRVEDLVDRRGDPDCLMWKIDYMLSSLPEWMLPSNIKDFEVGGRYRRHLQLVNPKTGSTISGQATTAHVGRGGRRTFILFDEMASMDHATDAWRSAADTTSCRIGNSTPLGPGTEFTRQRNLGLMHDAPKIITLGYWDHPQKGLGRDWRVDEDGEMTSISGRGYWWTPWFAEQVKRRSDPADVGQNILIDHTTSGDLFFNSAVVTQHLNSYGMDAVRMELIDGVFKETSGGRWFVWAELTNGIPTQSCNYAMFADIASGKGSSNSAIAVMDRESGTIVAEFVDPHTGPHELAQEACMAGATVFAGGTEGAFLGWEANGPGEAWYEDIRAENYTNVYFRRQLGKRSDRKTRDYGWRSDRKGKRVLLSGLSRAIIRNEINIPSKQGLAEMLEYVYYPDGSIGPGHMHDETTGARESHGDRVIAYAGVVYMRQEAPRFLEESVSYPPGSMGEILGHAEVMEG